MPFSQLGINLISEQLGAAILSISGKRKKCLILDLDNTLWGGIIGDDGVENLTLDIHGEGKAFYDFQKQLIKLYNSGIILAICSKNNEEVVWNGFKNHPYMLLKQEHFAAWQINWNDKSENIKLLSEDLNISLDAMVFIDDSPYERELVKINLPDVTVPDMPSDFVDYPRFISDLYCFETFNITAEDNIRGRMYVDERVRKDIKKKSRSVTEYLESLDIIIKIDRATKFTIPRISQLTQRTNQFNLSTKRYTDTEISNLASIQNYEIMTVNASDNIGEYGIIGVAIINYNNHLAELDTFLMSCRVLGRGIEEAFIYWIIKQLRGKQFKVLSCNYIPTKRNQIVEKFLLKNGFNRSSDGIYNFELNKAYSPPSWIKINHEQ
jgi:FkbH-like protein